MCYQSMTRNRKEKKKKTNLNACLPSGGSQFDNSIYCMVPTMARHSNSKKVKTVESGERSVVVKFKEE